MFLRRFFNFATFIEQAKKLERFRGQFYWKDYPKVERYESIADHSWRLSILLLLFEKRLGKKFNLIRALKLALIHDLPEIISGDESPLGEDGTGKKTYAFDENIKAIRFKKDLKAAKKLFGMLPKEEGGEFLKLWEEVELETSFEGKLVKALDKMEAMIQVMEYRKGELFPNHKEFGLNYGTKGADVDEILENFAKILRKKWIKEYREFKK